MSSASDSSLGGGGVHSNSGTTTSNALLVKYGGGSSFVPSISGTDNVGLTNQSAGQASVGLLLEASVNGCLIVRSVVPSSPAAATGQIEPGDVLTHVDGTDVHTYSLSSVRPLLCGPVGSDVSLVLARGDSTYHITLRRQILLHEEKRLTTPATGHSPSKSFHRSEHAKAFLRSISEQRGGIQSPSSGLSMSSLQSAADTLPDREAKNTLSEALFITLSRLQQAGKSSDLLKQRVRDLQSQLATSSEILNRKDERIKQLVQQQTASIGAAGSPSEIGTLQRDNDRLAAQNASLALQIEQISSSLKSAGLSSATSSESSLTTSIPLNLQDAGDVENMQRLLRTKETEMQRLLVEMDGLTTQLVEKDSRIQSVCAKNLELDSSLRQARQQIVESGLQDAHVQNVRELVTRVQSAESEVEKKGAVITFLEAQLTRLIKKQRSFERSQQPGNLSSQIAVPQQVANRPSPQRQSGNAARQGPRASSTYSRPWQPHAMHEEESFQA